MVTLIFEYHSITTLIRYIQFVPHREQFFPQWKWSVLQAPYKPHTAYALRAECVFNVEPGGTSVLSCSGSQSGSHGPSGGHAKILRGQRRMTENYEAAE